MCKWRIVYRVQTRIPALPFPIEEEVIEEYNAYQAMNVFSNKHHGENLFVTKVEMITD